MSNFIINNELSNSSNHLYYGLENNPVSKNDGGDRYEPYWHQVNNSYFESLSYNFGNNQTESTCGYVALGILLRYYDLYCNSSIVGTAYEVSASQNNGAAGTFHEPYNSLITPDSGYVAEYYDYLRYYSDESLHAYLILKHKNALLMNPPQNQIASTFAAEFGTNESILASLALSYLQERQINQYCTIVAKTSYNTSYSSSDIVSYIEGEINNNRPVVCGFEGHARIVYGYRVYNSGEVQFKTHEGYVDSSSHFTLDTPFAPSDSSPLIDNFDIGYLSLHFSFPS